MVSRYHVFAAGLGTDAANAGDALLSLLDRRVKYGGAMDPPSVKLLAAMAALIRSYAGTQQKPVWAGEFNTCIKELTEEQQAEWLDKAVHAAIEQGVSWFSLLG